MEMHRKVEMNEVEIDDEGGDRRRGILTGRWTNILEGEIIGKQANKYEALLFYSFMFTG